MIYAQTDLGKVRTINQDCYDFCIIDDNLAWALVCDGMGGASFGEVASNIAKETIRNEFEDFLYICETQNHTNDKIKETILKAITKANENIFNKSKEKNFSNMGTTVVVGVVFKNTLHIAHVGDSRAYIVSSDGMKQLTNDHSFVQEMVKSGRITPKEAKFSSQKNIITRALGVESDVSIDYENFSLKEKDKVFLCTDGLTNYIDGKELFNYFLEFEDEKIPGVLVKEANSFGGQDNITALLISKISWGVNLRGQNAR